MTITWVAIRTLDKTTGETTTDQNAMRSQCGNYTLSRHTAAGKTLFEAWHGLGLNAAFLLRSQDRAAVEQAVTDDMAKRAPKHLHENNDGQ